MARPDDAPFPAGLLSDIGPASEEAPAEAVVVDGLADDDSPSGETVAGAPAATDAEVEKE